ncbi:MAG: helix-turn-helix domain-containing protein [Lachnospiraceae bacterium]
MKNRVKELREQKQISQVCLATHVGCSQNTISKIELGTTAPKGELLIELSKYFNVSIDYLLCNSDYKYVQEVYYNMKKIEADSYEFLKIYEELRKEDKRIIFDIIQRLKLIRETDMIGD